MRLKKGKIPYTIVCEIDGCQNTAEYAFDAIIPRPAGRLHLCTECWRELIRLGKEEKIHQEARKG
ncbi:MAG TPA: hypothetical protein PLZ84_06750 [Clostridia bacterium]|nr:hypothetical protein [Clostridia bacterium]